MQRRRFLIGAGAVATLARPALAQLTGAPVRLVFPFGAGGGGDALCRLLAERLASGLGRPVIVENKTGADGRIGIQFVKQAPPDGDTILLTTGPTMTIMPQVHKAPGYDTANDFAPVAHLGTFEFGFAVANNVPAASLPELVAWLRANPAKATYGLPSLGTIPHFTGLQFAKLTGLTMTRLPYRGGAPAVQDVVGGQIPLAFVTVADALEQHRGGLLRIIATTGTRRSPFLPDVPTAREAGVGLDGSGWYGAWAPAKTPDSVIARIGGLMVDILQQADFKERVLKLGLIPDGRPAAELAIIQKVDAERWAPAIKESGFRME